MDDMSHEGRCTCGEVRYRMNSAPMIVHACHCTECQRLSGGPFAINALVETSHIDLLSGEPVLVPVEGTSGKAQTIMRCPKCQVAVWSHYPGAGPRIAFVRVGTLDQPDRLPPDIHIYTASKQPWVVLDPRIPAVAEYYAAEQHWRPSSLERRRVLRGR